MTKKKMPTRGVNIDRKKPKTEFTCSCCGVVYKTQKGNFFSSASELYRANDGYTTVCRPCVNMYYKKLLGEFNGNAERAIRHCCFLFDIYYADNIVAATAKEATDSRIMLYSGKLNMIQFKARFKTYLDTVLEEASKPSEEGTEEKDNETYNASPETIRFFGRGYSNEEYQYMQMEFDEWVERYEVKSKSEEELIKAICVAQLAIRQTQANRDIKEIEKAMNTFQGLLKTADLKPNRSASDAALSSENSFGMLIKKLENERPVSEPLEEWRDCDGIHKYIDTYYLSHIQKLSKRQITNEEGYLEEIGKYTVTPPSFIDDLEQGVPNVQSEEN